MPVLPEPMHSTAAAIYALHAARKAAEPPRAYLGCSVLGRECERQLWYGFRGAEPRALEGRIARLLDTGQREEARVLDELRAIGCHVWDRAPDGSQWAVEALGGHVRGHLDAVVRGLPEAPKAAHVVDVKTIKAEKYRALLKHGIAKQYPEYVAQAMLYMGLMELERAAYVFVNKDDDQIHVERIDFDRGAFDALIAKARRIVFAAEPPARASESPDSFICKWCDYQAVCWGTDVPPATCRTCAHVTPTESGAWHCERHGADRTVEEQRRGCGDHRVIPILLAQFADAVDSDGDSVTYLHRETGREFRNGPRPGYSSSEIAACGDKTMLADAVVDQFRSEFDGAIVNA